MCGQGARAPLRAPAGHWRSWFGEGRTAPLCILVGLLRLRASWCVNIFRKLGMRLLGHSRGAAGLPRDIMGEPCRPDVNSWGPRGGPFGTIVDKTTWQGIVFGGSCAKITRRTSPNCGFPYLRFLFFEKNYTRGCRNQPPVFKNCTRGCRNQPPVARNSPGA